MVCQIRYHAENFLELGPPRFGVKVMLHHFFLSVSLCNSFGVQTLNQWDGLV